MKAQITFQLVRLMNWEGRQQQVKVEVTFFSAQNQTYIAHKSLLSHSNQNTLQLNAQFKISYHPSQNYILCKVSLLSEPNKRKQLIAQTDIDLNILSNMKGNILYLPIHADPNKILEIRRIDFTEQQNFETNSQSNTYQINQKTQQEFLKQRYDFLQRISHREIEMKKNFSQKVYNLLKDIKYARAIDQTKKEVFQNKKQKDTSEKVQYTFQTPLRQNIDFVPNQRNQMRGNFMDERLAPRNPKQTRNYKLMLDSMQTYNNKDMIHNLRDQNRY